MLQSSVSSFRVQQKGRIKHTQQKLHCNNQILIGFNLLRRHSHEVHNSFQLGSCHAVSSMETYPIKVSWHISWICEFHTQIHSYKNRELTRIFSLFDSDRHRNDPFWLWPSLTWVDQFLGQFSVFIVFSLLSYARRLFDLYPDNGFSRALSSSTAIRALLYPRDDHERIGKSDSGGYKQAGFTSAFERDSLGFQGL